MTAETSNARGETYTFDMIEDAWGDVVPLTKPYFNRFRARLETLRQSADPPPAAEGVQAEPKAEAQLTYKGVPIGPMQTFADIERQATVPADPRAAAEQAIDEAFKRMAPDDYKPMPDRPVPMEKDDE